MLPLGVLFLAALGLACWIVGSCAARAGSQSPIGTSNEPTLGAAVIIGATGYLLLAGVATPTATAISTGLLAFMAALVRRPSWSVSGSWLTIHPLLLGLIIAVIVLFVALPPSFNGSDDSPSYYVFVREIVAKGWLSPQPFSERRLYTLGGHLPLAALATLISALPALQSLTRVSALPWSDRCSIFACLKGRHRH